MIHMRGFCLMLCFLLSSFLPSSLQAQEQYAVRISFSDKNATEHSFSNPEDFLSERAIERRIKYTISIDSSDLPIPNNYLTEVIQLSSGLLHVTSKWLNTAVILMPDTFELAAIRTLPFVHNTKLVAFYEDGLHQRPADLPENEGPQLTGFGINYYGSAWNQIHLCKGEILHELGLQGQDMLIAVIDVGFNGVDNLAAFDSLRLEGRIVDTRNFIELNDSVFQYSGHGTQVLSCMAALMPETYVGTAPYANYALYTTDHLTTEQSIEEDNWVAAIERADSLGADVVNSSLGYSSFDNPDDSYPYSQLDGHTTLVAQASNIATAKGMVVVASAGNEGNNEWVHLLTPGDADSALTVGAVDYDKIVADFSSRGPNAAGLMKPDVAVMGKMAAVVNSNGQVVQQSGTSIASPILTGLLTCLLQANPQTPPHQLRTIIRAAGHIHNQPNNDIGHGVPDFSVALEEITSIVESEELSSGLLLYPNPTRKGFYLQSEDKLKQAGLRILSITGQVVLEQSLSGQQFLYVDVSRLPAGMYLVEISMKSERQFKKLVLQ